MRGREGMKERQISYTNFERLVGWFFFVVLALAGVLAWTLFLSLWRWL